MANPFPPMTRKYFFWSIVALVLLQVMATVADNFVAIPVWLARSFNTSVTVVIALVTGARLADAGYRFWVGTAAILALIWALPAIGVFLAILVFGVTKADVLSNAPLGVIGIVLAVFVFVIWAGTRASVARPPRSTHLVGPGTLSGQFVDDREDHQRTRRVEPRF
jgi:hypothetical protein